MPVLIAVDPTILDRCSCRASVRDCHTTNPSNPPTYSTLPARLGVYLCLNRCPTMLQWSRRACGTKSTLERRKKSLQSENSEQIHEIELAFGTGADRALEIVFAGLVREAREELGRYRVAARRHRARHGHELLLHGAKG